MFRSRTSPSLTREIMTRGGRVLCVGMKVRDYPIWDLQSVDQSGMEFVGTLSPAPHFATYHDNSILGYLRCQLTILHHHSTFTHHSKCHLELLRRKGLWCQ